MVKFKNTLWLKWLKNYKLLITRITVYWLSGNKKKQKKKKIEYKCVKMQSNKNVNNNHYKWLSKGLLYYPPGVFIASSHSHFIHWRPWFWQLKACNFLTLSQRSFLYFTMWGALSSFYLTITVHSLGFKKSKQWAQSVVTANFDGLCRFYNIIKKHHGFFCCINRRHFQSMLVFHLHPWVLSLVLWSSSR